MAEAGQDDENRKSRTGWNEGQRQAKDQTKRNKSDRSNTSQGPLSSIKAAFRRTSSKLPLSDNSAGEKRRPEITIVSVEPLPATSWFAGAPRKFLAHPASSQTVWDGGVKTSKQLPPSYDQVIQEKTQEKVQTPVAPPRQSHTSSIATQTEEQRTIHKPEQNRSAESAKNIKKPPRVSHPCEVTSTATLAINHNSSQLCSAQQASVLVSDTLQTGSVQSESFTPSTTLHPVPRPRSKPKLQTIDKITHDKFVTLQEDDNSDLVTLKENNPPLSRKELLEIFDSEIPQIEASEEDLIEDMAGLYSERNIRARIQEFENQVTTEETSVPTPRPRNSRPAVGTKPSVPPRASISSTTAGETDVRDETNNYFNEVLDDHINPTPTYWRPQLSTKPSLNSFDQVKPLIKSPPQLPSRSSLRRSNTLNSRDEEDGFNSSPFSPTTLSKQILNVNNHNNSAQNDYMDAGINWTSAAIPRPVGRKPTIIRVPTRQEDEMTFPPALPVQKAIGGPPPSLRYKESFGYASEPNLPPRPGVGKQFPPRPPPAKSGPGRPPPPRKDGIQRNSSMLQSQQTQRTTRKVSRKGPVLPPRPNPGHRLYNSYTLEIPHGIAEFDHNGMHTGELSFQKNEVLVLLNQKDSNTFECQVGDAKGTVQKSHMKIITPLSNYCHEVQPVPQQSSSHPAFGSSRLLKVQALYDFTPEGPGELGLRAGDIITDVEQLDSEWYLGTCRGMTGFFPINYVKPLSGSPAPPPSPTPAPAPAKPAAHNVRGPRCVARFDFEADESSELSFTEGEVIRLLEYVGEEWARGEIGSHQGIFPLNFVEVVEDLPSPSVKNQPRIPLPGMAASNNKQAAASTPKHVKVERFLALYDFNTETDGDLSFYRGDVIELIEHIDEEWSQGRLNGKEGIFPTSFTQPHTGGFLSR